MEKRLVEKRLVEKRLSSWLAEKGVQGSIPGLAATISEICYLLLPSRDMTERSLSLKTTSNQLNMNLVTKFTSVQVM